MTWWQCHKSRWAALIFFKNIWTLSSIAKILYCSFLSDLAHKWSHNYYFFRLVQAKKKVSETRLMVPSPFWLKHGLVVLLPLQVGGTTEPIKKALDYFRLRQQITARATRRTLIEWLSFNRRGTDIIEVLARCVGSPSSCRWFLSKMAWWCQGRDRPRRWDTNPTRGGGGPCGR